MTRIWTDYDIYEVAELLNIMNFILTIGNVSPG